MAVSRVSISDVLSSDCDVEHKCNKSGAAENIDGCVGSKNPMGSDRKLNVCKPEGGQTRFVASLSVLASLAQEKIVRDVALMRVPSAEMPTYFV